MQSCRWYQHKNRYDTLKKSCRWQQGAGAANFGLSVRAHALPLVDSSAAFIFTMNFLRHGLGKTQEKEKGKGSGEREATTAVAMSSS